MKTDEHMEAFEKIEAALEEAEKTLGLCAEKITLLETQKSELLEVMTALCRLKYGNLNPEVYAEIEKAEAAIAKARGKGGEA